MSDPADATKHAEDAAAALDAYQNQVISDGTITHRQSPLLATTLVRALINDLARYADQANIDFDAILGEVASARSGGAPEAPTRDHPYRVGSGVELKQDTGRRADSAAAPARRGYVTAIEEPTDYGEPIYLVRFPGIPAGEFHLTASNLRPAASFPPTTTRTASIRSAAQAEQNLVTVAARILDARHGQQPVELADLTDRALLAETLGQWTGTSGERVLLSLGFQVEQAAARLRAPEPVSAKTPGPAELARADFPQDINDGVPIPPETNASLPRPSGPSDGPKRQP